MAQGNITSLTLTSGNGGTVFGSKEQSATGTLNAIAGPTVTSVVESQIRFTSNFVPAYDLNFGVSTGYDFFMYTGNTWSNGSGNPAGTALFCGGMGAYQADSGNASTGGTSVLSGNGGNPGANGTVPGGAGGSVNDDGSAGGYGAAGNVRVYHL